MFAVQKKLKSASESPAADSASASSTKKRSVDMRQRLLQKEFESMVQLPSGCTITFPDPDVLFQFKLQIVPDSDSLWHGGRFEFVINVPEGCVLLNFS